MNPLRIAINAQLALGGTEGGVAQFVLSLVRALGQLEGPEEYIVIVSPENPDWVAPYVGKNQRIVRGTTRGWIQRMKQNLGPLREPARIIRRRLRGLAAEFIGRSAFAVPESNGFLESLNVDLIHFPYQAFIRSSLPAAYNPHDLQHLHYPDFFTPELWSSREAIYRVACAEARVVATESRAVKDDVVRQYGTNPRKIHVIYRGSPTEFYEPISQQALDQVKTKYALPEPFAYYPAVTFEHKNHVRLLEAMAFLRDREDVTIHLVCTGGQTEFARKIQQARRDHKLEKQVHFLGFVSPAEVRALYRLAQFVILPSLFEGGGFPVLEAFFEGTPVACSALPPLIEYGGEAVYAFDPTSVEGIAGALHRLSRDAELRESMRRRGTARVRLFSWERTAKTYRALYRQVAGRVLSDEDRVFLEASL